MAFWKNKTLPDKELAEGISKGDEACFEALFKKYYVVVRKFISRFIGDDFQAAEDLAQEIFIRLWNRRHSIDSEKSIKNWMIVSARNSALNWLKSKAKKPEAVMSEIDEDSAVSQDQNIESIYLRQLGSEIDRAIDALPDKRRTVFRMSRFEHLPNEEIAARLGLSVRTVEKHIELALRNLRKGNLS